MNALTTFDFNSTPIRVVTIKKDPWFVASDALKAMGYGTKSHGHVMAKLGKDESSLNSVQTGLRPQRIVSESGLYKLVMRSDKPEARAFQDWVTRDVLPALRRDGMYVVGEEKVASGEMSDEELELLVMERLRNKVDRLRAERDAIRIERDTALTKVVELEPRAAIADQLVEHRRTLANVLGKFPGVNRNMAPKALQKLGYLYRSGGSYRVYSKYRDKVFGERLTGDHGTSTIIVLEAGYELLVKLYRAGQLPMKKGCRPMFGGL